jgi:hypothetical protein
VHCELLYILPSPDEHNCRFLLQNEGIVQPCSATQAHSLALDENVVWETTRYCPCLFVRWYKASLLYPKQLHFHMNQQLQFQETTFRTICSWRGNKQST